MSRKNRSDRRTVKEKSGFSLNFCIKWSHENFPLILHVYDQNKTWTKKPRKSADYWRSQKVFTEVTWLKQIIKWLKEDKTNDDDDDVLIGKINGRFSNFNLKIIIFLKSRHEREVALPKVS